MAARTLIAVLLLCGSGAEAMSKVESQAALSMNPIRKVVMMLQNMQIKIAAEGEKKETMFDKYMCYCQNGEGALQKSIADGEAKIEEINKLLGSGIAEKKQLEAEVAEAKENRKEAEQAIAEATALREKEAAEFAKFKSDSDQNIAAIDKAVPAIEKGMEGSFLQTREASVLRKLSVSAEMNSGDRDLLASFLEQGEGYAPRSGEIVGILKQMRDEMAKDLEEATKVENERIASYEGLVAAKKKEIEACTKAIESKSARIGDLSVKLAGAENELEDTKEAVAEDKKFLADLDKNCELKKKEWEEYKQAMATEQVALADTIKILNDDDALELFKKTLPSASSSFMQVKVTAGAMRERAMTLLKAGNKADPRLDLIEIAMRGGKNGFEKIIKMIDELVAQLGEEQKADDEKKDYCNAELDKTEDTKKELELDISDLDKAIADAEETIAQLKSEIEALEDGIKALDKQVAEATENRKEEHDDFVAEMAQNTNAKDLLDFAKNRLNKFYNPKLYKPPPKRVLSEEDQVVVNMGGTLAPTAAPGGIAGTGIALSQVAPPPPPEANLAFKKSGQESNGVIAMIDLLIADLDKEMQVSQVEEKDAQKDYETFMADAAEKRATDSKAITDKEALKAETEEQLQTDTDDKKSKTTELMETDKYLAGLHADCDWLLKYYDARKAARAGEVDSLGKAKDVLNGADYSLIQTAASHLRGSK
jgi:predicted  nucleic acid-binding Zn-ribbon protein